MVTITQLETGKVGTQHYCASYSSAQILIPTKQPGFSSLGYLTCSFTNSWLARTPVCPPALSAVKTKLSLDTHPE